MSIKIKLAQLSLLLVLFVGAVAAVPARDNMVLASKGIMTTMGECSGGVGCST